MQITNTCHLIIGLPGSGKSTLLAECGLKFPGAIEIGLQPSLVWEDVFKTIKPKSVVGIIWVIDWTMLFEKNQDEQPRFISELMAILYKKISFSCPLYVLLTKVDRLTGFREFFADLSLEERHQACGIDFSAESTTQTTLETHWDHFLKRLHDRVLWRIHQERHPAKRALIQHFPLQVEILKNKFITWFDSFLPVVNVPLRGIYLTSSRQQGEVIDLLQQGVMQMLPMTELLPFTVSAGRNSQPYFTRQLLKKIMTQTVLMTDTTLGARIKRFSIYAVLGIAVITSGLLLARSLNAKIENINAAERAVASYNTLSQQLAAGDHRDLSQILPALNALRQAVISLQQASLPWLVRRQHDVETLAEKTYHQALVNYFLPSLGDLLVQPLANTSDPAALYGALKTYLMLGDPSRFDSAFVKEWLITYWQKTLVNNPDLRGQLTAHLNQLLMQPVPPIELNQALVTGARNGLMTRPAEVIAYAVLKSRVENVPVFPIENIQSFSRVFITQNLTIPSIYTAAQFSDIYFHKVNSACKAVVNGDWVLGAGRTQDEKELRKSVQELYLQDYANAWEAWLNALKITPWRNWNEEQTAFSSLLSNQSPLITVLRTVTVNTSLKQLFPFGTVMSEEDKNLIQINLTNKFQAFVDLLPDFTDSTALSNVLQTLNHLHDYLTPIAESHSDEAAFLAAEKRFSPNNAIDPLDNMYVVANNLSPPLHEWFNALADNSWHLLLAYAAQYLNDRWQSEVWPEYDLHLNKRYPFFKKGEGEVSLKEFTDFFSNEGVLNSFVKKYLMSFIDTNNAVWQWRQVDGQTLKVTPALIIQLERAHIISSMFFHGEQDPSVDFTLQPLDFEPGVHHFVLNLDAQTLSDHPDMPVTHRLHWPGSVDAPVASFSFTDAQGQETTAMETGTWALFKLLDKANLQSTGDPRRFLLTFDLNGNAARYQLMASQVINPFIPDIIDQFRCPDKLIPSS